MTDQLIIFLYLFTLFIITIYFRSKSKKFSDYTKIGNSFASNRLIFVAAIFTTSVGGGTTFGIPEKVYQGELHYPIALILVIGVDLLIAKYLVPRLKSFEAQSLGDVLNQYYGKMGKFIGGLSTILISIGYMTVQMSVATYIFEFFVKIDHIKSVIISYGIIIIFNLIGGVKSIFANHVLQFLAIIISIPTIFIISIKYIGISKIITYINSSHNFSISLDMNLLIAIISFSLMSFHPSLIQRVAMSKDAKIVTDAIYIKSIIYLFLLILITFNGIFTQILHPNIEPWQALPYMINNIIPDGIRGVVIIGLLASVLSTADSELNIASLSLINDILLNLVKLKDNKIIFLISRILIPLLGILAIMASIYFENLIDLVIFAAGFWVPVILVPSIFALYRIYTSRIYFLLSSSCGFLAFALWQIFFISQYKINSVIIGFIVNLIIFLYGILIAKKQEIALTKD
jgi:Na+/proline symporter